MDIASWVSAAAAVISIAGGGFSYYRSNLSKKAKTEAEEEHRQANLAEQRAAKAVQTAESLLGAVQQQVEVLQQELPAIAEAVEKSGADLHNTLASGNTALHPRIEWVKGIQYAIVNPCATALRIESVRNRDAFLRLSLEDSFEVPPLSRKTFTAGGAMQRPLPDNLVLDEIGADEPVYLAIPPKR
ncbi:hypothetical protein [Alloscardovia criceti]|uniref:hypothetical protein n=1 Tax=Alloscardovia criceti TaxID=356828 RepID=UPI00037232C2|nr:hypothetical protein [Alloscardovia criceti]